MTFVPYEEAKQVTQVFLFLQSLRLRNAQIPLGAREGYPGGEGVKRQKALAPGCLGSNAGCTTSVG